MEITLTDGRIFNQTDISFDSNTYTFRIIGTGEDVTLLVPITGKRLYSDFDANTYAGLVYSQGYRDAHSGQSPPPVGSTSTLANLVDQLTTDPLGAPIADANSLVKNTFKDVLFNPFASATGLVVIGVILCIVFPEIPEKIIKSLK